MEVCSSLTKERTIGCSTLFSCSETLESFLDYGRVLTMVVSMHLDIRGAYVYLVTALL